MRTVKSMFKISSIVITKFITRLILVAILGSLTLTPVVSAASYNSGIIVQPVFVQSCPQSQACPLIDYPFNGTYTVTAYSGKVAVATATTTGPGQYTLAVPAGTYSLTFTTKGYRSEPMDILIPVADGQVVGPYQLHFILR